MEKIVNIDDYNLAVARVEEILNLVDDTTPEDNPFRIELLHLSNLVADYCDEHFPFA